MREETDIIHSNAPLYPFQKKRSAIMQQYNRYGLLSLPGTGKSLVTLDATVALDNILIICPKTLIGNWEKEINKWDFEIDRFDIFNHDKFVKKDSKAFKQLKDSYDCLIIDEHHTCLKSWGAKRCKNIVYNIIPRCKKVYCLSATPATNSAADLHPMLSVLTYGAVGSFRDFVQKFAKRIEGAFGVQYKGYRNIAELREIIFSCCGKDTLDEVGKEMPSVIFDDVWTDTKTEEIPDGMKQSIGGEFMSTLAKNLGMQKVDRTIELVNTIPESVVIMCYHREVFEKYCQAFNCAGINGDTPSHFRSQIIDRFNSTKGGRIVLNYQSGSAGINLQSAKYLVLAEFTWRSDLYEQALGRITRLGSEHKNNVIYNINGTCWLDHAMYNSMKAKTEKRSETLKGLK